MNVCTCLGGARCAWDELHSDRHLSSERPCTRSRDTPTHCNSSSFTGKGWRASLRDLYAWSPRISIGDQLVLLSVVVALTKGTGYLATSCHITPCM